MIDNIFRIFNMLGALHYGEEVTQLEHVLQSAFLARQDGAPDALVAAALLHDIGQFMDHAGDAAERKGVDARHEVTGAAFLSPYFDASVTEPIRLHVDAKRFLCATEPGYLESLSRASLLSLRLQGGSMSEEELNIFKGLDYSSDAIRLRRFDDQGKRRGWAVPDLESYRPLLRALMKHPE